MPPASWCDGLADAFSDVRHVVEASGGDVHDKRVCLVVGQGEPMAVEPQERDDRGEGRTPEIDVGGISQPCASSICIARGFALTRSWAAALAS